MFTAKPFRWKPMPLHVRFVCFSATANMMMPAALWSTFSPTAVLSVWIRKYSMHLASRQTANMAMHKWFDFRFVGVSILHLA